MSEIEKIQRYIERTAIPGALTNRYSCTWHELEAAVSETAHPLEAMCLAFKYGRSKGYRAGKKAAELERDKAHSEKRQRMTAVRPTVQADERKAVQA